MRPGPALSLVLPDDPDLVPIFFRAVGWAFSGSLSLPKERHPKNWQRGFGQIQKNPRVVGHVFFGVCLLRAFGA